MWSPGLDTIFQLHLCQMRKQQTLLISCSLTSWGLHSRIALTLKVPTSYCNFITTDYLSVNPNLLQNYCSARQNTLLGKHDLHFSVPWYIILYFTKLKYTLFACASIFTNSPSIINNDCFLLDLSWKPQRPSVNFVLSFISVRIQVKIKQASLHKFKRIAIMTCLSTKLLKLI